MKKIFHHYKFIILITSITLCGNHAVNASSVEPDLAIINARLIDESGELQSDMSILISSGKILQVSKNSNLQNVTRVINANNRIVLPGFIDSHVHLIAHLNANNNQSLTEQLKTDVVPKLEDYLRHGVTTIKSLADPVDAILVLREQLRSGDYPGPRLLTAGRAIGAKDGHPGKTMSENMPWLREQINIEIDSVEQSLQAVQDLHDRQVDAIKIFYSGNEKGNNSYRFMNMAPPRLPVKVMQAAVAEAHRYNLPVTAHTVQLEEAFAAVQAGVNGLEHGVVIEPITSQLLDILYNNKVTYVPTLRMTKYFLNDIPARVPQENLVKVVAAGISVALGTDSGGHDLPYGNAVLDEAELMAVAGLTPLQVIRAMTVNAARHLGLDDEIGTIVVTKRADIVIVDGDPLKNISDLRKVWKVLKDGQIMFEQL